MQAPEKAEKDAAPAHIRALCAACEEHVRRSVGTPLDGTAETLPLLDHYLRRLDDGSPGAVHELAMSAAGAYFGEIVRRRFDCRWHAPEGEPHRWRIEFATIFLHFNPAAIAYEAIVRRGSGLGASFETFEEDQEALRALLATQPPVRKGDFYTLGLRLEVLERVVSELTLLARARGDREEWTAQDYRAAAEEPV